MFVGKLLKIVGVGLLSGAAAQAGAELVRSAYPEVYKKFVRRADDESTIEDADQSDNECKAMVERA